MIEVLLALAIAIAHCLTGWSIVQKQEESLRVGKLRQSRLVLAVNGVTFVGIVNLFGFLTLTIWAGLLALVFILPLVQIPYNGRYNRSFAKTWMRYKKGCHWTYATCILAWCLF